VETPPRIVRVLSTAFFLCGLGDVCGNEPVLALGSGDRRPARLTGIDDGWNVTFQTETGGMTVAAGDLIRWGGGVDVDRGPVVVLGDGGMLVANSVQLSDNQLDLSCPLWGDLALPLANVRGVVFHPPGEDRLRDQLWDRLRAADGETDWLRLDNGDTVRGTLVRMDDERATVRTSAGQAELPADRISTIDFHAATSVTPPPAATVCQLGFRDGTSLMVRGAMLADGHVAATTLDGLRLSSDPGVDAGQEVVLLQTIRGGVTYLSDLKPLGYRHIPFLTLTWPLGIDRNAWGSRLRFRGTVYEKGLGMPSASRVVYRLGGQYRRLDAQLAMDDRAGRGGSVVFRVYVEEGQGEWREAYESPVVRGGQAALPLSVDLGGAQYVALVVDSADRVDQQDVSNWLDACVVK
jgi:hypothetical protein